jgi:hypothetical protein
MDTKRLKKRLARLYVRKAILDAAHMGNEKDFTYHGGHHLGYVKGQISILEEVLDSLGVDVDRIESTFAGE